MEMEKQGVPTVLTTTTSFKGLAKIEAKAMGLPDIAILAVPHPLGAGLTEDKVIIRAENAMKTLVKLMIGQS